MKPSPRSGRRLLRLISLAKPYWVRLVLASVSLIGSALLGLVPALIFGQVIDATNSGAPRSAIDHLVLILIGASLLAALLQWHCQYWTKWVGERVVADLRVRLQRHLLRLEPAYFRRTRTGELLSRTGSDVTRLQLIVGQDLASFLRSLVSALGGAAALCWIDVQLAMVALLVVPPLMMLTRFSGSIIRRLSHRLQGQAADASGTLAEGLAAIETVQAFTREDFEADRYQDSIEEAFSVFNRRTQVQTAFQSGALFLSQVAVAGVLWMGAVGVQQSTLTVGALTSFFVYTMMVSGGIGSLLQSTVRAIAAIGATERIFQILDQEPTIQDPPEPVDLSDPVGVFGYENVNFAYETGGEEVLRSVTFEVGAGQVCALVGASGAGKSTLAHLALRFWDPTEGRVTFDGKDLRTLRLADLRGATALVSQDPILFSGTIRENIRYGRLEASDVEVEVAAEAANAHEFVMAFSEGYDTLVGERGVTLSGGQRQRISIARAVLRDPRLLILDEATSALDSESEAQVQEALSKLQSGRTTLVIAHRLSSVRDADQIIVLEHGSVAEKGQHDELLKLGGVYSKLVSRQLAGASSSTDGEPLRSAR